ncbi:MAG TPA: alpha/beta fold hydrolase [Mycobacteriales bacterium]|nr:alpha/beta fold hydrolase [Mycobacteriales bacterium]
MTSPAQDGVRTGGADGSPLDVMLTDAALGPIRRLLPGMAAVKLAGRLTARPVATAALSLRTAAALGKVAVGRSAVEPPPRDRRFSDPAWTGNPLLRRLCQAYLVSGAALEQLVDAADLDWRSDRRMRFLVQMLVDASAPSNNPFLNPAALKAGLETGGRNYRDGARQFAQDMRTSPRIPAMVDGSGFTVGGNIAVSEGAVVLQTPIFELLQYVPRTKQVREVPLLLVPPMINKFYIADLAPGRSMVEHLLDNGHQVFAMSWRNPAAVHRGWDLDAYVRSVLDALTVLQEVTGAERSHLLGLCAGGIVSTLAVAHLAAIGEQQRIAGLTLGVTLLDQERAGTVGAMVDEATARVAVAQSARKGYLDGKALAGVFAWLRPNDLIWNYWVNNYMQGRQPPAFDILYWNADTTRMTAGLHRDFIEIAVGNSLTEAGRATMLGTPVDLSTITVDTYVTAGIADHLCPWQGCYRTTQLLGGESRFILSTNGHIASLVNPPTNPKSTFQVAASTPPDPEEWLAAAETTKGSWWPDYTAWLAERSGEEVPAPSALGGGRREVLAEAPGTYVFDK